MVNIEIGYVSGKILKEPILKKHEIQKGALILSQCDYVVSKINKLKKYFFIIERRAWEGLNESKEADIKLIEDLSYLNETKKLFPKKILLDIGPADFVDIDSFKPLNIKKEYTGIQISSWDKFKRPFLFLKGISLLQKDRFIRLGHMVKNGQKEELDLVNRVKDFIKEKNLINLDIPYLNTKDNSLLPKTKSQINLFLNKAKVGILTTKVEGINRFKMECLSSNIPVLVPKDASFPTKKHINEKTGILFDPTPEGLKGAINFAKKNYKKFSPRKYVLKNTGIKNSLKKLIDSLNLISGTENKFDEIYWDGRNQSLEWGDKLIKKLKIKIREYEKTSHKINS